MSRNKRDETQDAPTFDLSRLIRDLGGDRAVSERMIHYGFPLWELKTMQARRRRGELRVSRLCELMHVQRLEGRPFNPLHYITWSTTCPYPQTPTDLPQPVPVSQRE